MTTTRAAQIAKAAQVTRAAQVTDHDMFSTNSASTRWPQGNVVESNGDYSSDLSIHMHQHFCELLAAWNLNPARTFQQAAYVYQDAELHGQSKFIFFNRESANGFIDTYKLNPFIINYTYVSGEPYSAVLHLANKFPLGDIREFLTVYRSAINNLATIHDERNTAIKYDGGKVGFMTVDHFYRREVVELERIAKARFELATGNHGAIGTIEETDGFDGTSSFDGTSEK